jgi:hypothetical protein
MTDLEERLQRIEAELAIRNLINLYGLAADCGDITTALHCHTEDAVYIVSNPNAGRGDASADLQLRGHDEIAAMLRSDLHQSLLPNCAHTTGPVTLSVERGAAQAVGYSRLYHIREGAPTLMRLAVNHWQFRHETSGWKICQRTSRLVGEAEAQNLLATHLQSFTL